MRLLANANSHPATDHIDMLHAFHDAGYIGANSLILSSWHPYRISTRDSFVNNVSCVVILSPSWSCLRKECFQRNYLGSFGNMKLHSRYRSASMVYDVRIQAPALTSTLLFIENRIPARAWTQNTTASTNGTARVHNLTLRLDISIS